jgi:hypothetical protein
MAYTDAQLASFLSKVRAANREKEQAIPGVSEPNLKCTPKKVRAEQMEQFEQALQQQRRECKKGGWRAAAKWLEENCEEYRESKARPMPGGKMASSDICPNSEVANQPQPLATTPESPQSAPAALSAPSLIPLPSALWQALLHGSRDALVSPSEANTALRLVACELGKDSDVIEFTESIRINTLRKVLDARFGAGAWPVMNKLWRSAPASPGAPQPREDQSQLPPGPLPVGRNQPRWVAELNEPGGAEREWLTENGLWCG